MLLKLIKLSLQGLALLSLQGCWLVPNANLTFEPYYATGTMYGPGLTPYTHYNDQGLGTPASPYQLYYVAQLLDLENHPEAWGSIFSLEESMDLDYQSFQLGTEAVPFSGSFLGNQQWILNLGLSNQGNDVGFFGNLSGSVQDLTVTGQVSGAGNVGLLVGNSTGSVVHCSGLGDVTGENQVGGLIGANYGPVSRSKFQGSVTGENSVGGIIGQSSGITASLTNSYATGSVQGDALASNSFGGLVGSSLEGASIAYAYSSSDVTCETCAFVGGLVGTLSGSVVSPTLNNSFYTGNVSGDSEVAYDCGLVQNAFPSNLYAWAENECLIQGFDTCNTSSALTLLFDDSALFQTTTLPTSLFPMGSNGFWSFSGTQLPTLR